MNALLSHPLTWGAPLWFCALAVLPLIAALFAWGERRRVQLLQRLVAARLQPVLAGSVSLVKRRLRFVLALGALACFAFALAQPRYGYTVEEARRKGRDVLIAVDTSRSMLANDVAPNRLERAKFAAQDLINALEGDRLGLVAFAGSAFLQAPLTVDYSAVFSALGELDTEIIPLGGTSIAEAIRTATEAFGKGESESRCLVLFTDGEDLGTDALEVARKAAGTMRIFTVGIGSPDGSLIPVSGENGGTQFVKGPDGQFVKSRLDEKALTGIAEATGGFYLRLQNGPADMHRLVAEGLGRMKEEEIDARMSHRPIERYQWPLGLGIALLMVSVLMNERRRKLPTGTALAWVFALATGIPHPASAATSEELYKQGRYDEARQQYETALQRRPGLPALEFDKGVTDYALGNLDAAAEAFGRALAESDPKLRAKVEQNLGTTLLKRALSRDESKQAKEREADLKNSTQHLEEALKLETSNKDAKLNLAIAKKELEKPKPTPTPPPSSKDNQPDNSQDDKDQQSKDQPSKDQQSKDQPSKDQQSKDQPSKDQQSKDQQSKDQQSKDQQSKDQQSKDQQSKDQQSKDQQSKDQPSKDQQSKDQQSRDQQSKDQQSKDQQSKDQQSRDQQSKDQQSKDQQSKNQQSKGEQSQAPPTDEKKLSGEIKANESKPDEKQDAQAEVPVKPGEMSPSQARALLDSLKGEDGQPFKHEQRSAAPVSRNW
ncbi:MAG: VWA domain-containing protein [Verrucomicrobia bacterium]|nr:VWA domain-containing protein [Verrucomicrobiota bacterium]